MQKYLKLLDKILSEGKEKDDRTGIGTLSVSGIYYNIKVSETAFPIVTTKKIFWKNIIHELIWMLSGNTDVSYLEKHNVRIWNPWKLEDGTIGKAYGYQWRNYNGIDQIVSLEYWLSKKKPYVLHVNAWNEDELDEMALPPCHMTWFVYKEKGKLSLTLYQRSGDMFIGVPYNISFYSLLLLMLCKTHNYKPGKFHHVIGDAHIYKNHIPMVKQQLKRKPYPLPQVVFKTVRKSITDYTHEDIELVNYQHHDFIKAPVAV